jgi:hypothetical protein
MTTGGAKARSRQSGAGSNNMMMAKDYVAMVNQSLAEDEAPTN